MSKQIIYLDKRKMQPIRRYNFIFFRFFFKCITNSKSVENEIKALTVRPINTQVIYNPCKQFKHRERDEATRCRRGCQRRQGPAVVA